MNEVEERQVSDSLSPRLTEFVTIVFGVVIAESFARYSSYILHPTLSLAFVGLMAVYITTISSWIFYHRSAIRYPYNGGLGILRFALDFITVGLYAYLLYSLELIARSAQLTQYLVGFAVIFFVYIFSGLVRRKEHHDPKASRVILLGAFFIAFLVAACVYEFVLATKSNIVNWLFLLLPPLLNVVFRLIRWRYY